MPLICDQPNFPASRVGLISIATYSILIGKELRNPIILEENLYNMNETEILLTLLNSLKVLTSQNNLRNYGGAEIKRTLITAIEYNVLCISADDKYLPPLVIWPAATHRSN